MSTITTTPELALLLKQLKDVTEIRDPKGAVVGVFTPTSAIEGGGIWTASDLEEAERTLAAERNSGLPSEEVWRQIRGCA